MVPLSHYAIINERKDSVREIKVLEIKRGGECFIPFLQ